MGDHENSVRDRLPGDGVLFADDKGMFRGVSQFDNAVFGFFQREFMDSIICQIAG